MSEWLWLILAWAEPALMLAYFALFVARRDVSVRPRALAVIALVGTAAQLIFLAEQSPSPSSASVVNLLTRVIFIAVLLGMRGTMLVRARADDVRAELAEACRRLFVASQEQGSGLLVSARGLGVGLWLWKMGPFTLVTFPRPPVPGRLTLLFDWLFKRYPGPIPRIRVSLTGGKSSCPPPPPTPSK